MVSALGFAITATDQTAAAFERVNTRIEDFQKKTQTRMEAATASVRRMQAAMARFGDVSGLTRVAGALGRVVRAGTDAYQRIGQVVPLIGIVGSAASVAGVTRMVEAWTALGSRAGFAAQRIGISAGQLTAFQGAGRLAGASAEGVTSGLQALGQTMYDALGGRAPEAVVMFRTLGISFSDTAGHARSVTEVLPQVADKIAAIRNPFAQAQVAATLFGGAAEELLPFLRRGSAGIREYTMMAERYGAISDAGARAAERLREAQARVSLAVDGLRNKIAERLEPVLTPLLMRFAEWIATSPAVAHAVDWLGQKVAQLGHWIEGGGIQRFGETVQAWLEPLGSVVHFLGGDGGVLGAVEGLAALMVGSFALKVIAPWFALTRAILAATVAVGRFGLASAAVGGKGLLALLGRAGIAGLGGFGAHEALKTIDPNDDMGAWIDRNIPGAGAVDNFASHFGLGRSYEQQRQHEEQRQGAPRAGGGPISGVQQPPSSAAVRAASNDTISYLMGKGWTQDAAAGVAGNLKQESSFQPNGRPGDGGAAHGIMQWHQARQNLIEAHFNKRLSDMGLHEQLDALDWETRTFSPDTFTKMQRMKAGQAGATFSLEAERPGIDADAKAREARLRYGLAEQALSYSQAGSEDTARQTQAPAMQPPQARGEPLALASPDRRDDKASQSQSHVRLHITGDKGFRANVLESSSAVKVEGPLVERPGLLGAQA